MRNMQRTRGFLFFVSFFCWLVWGSGWWLFATILFGLVWLIHSMAARGAKNSAEEPSATADPVVVTAPERPAQEPLRKPANPEGPLSTLQVARWQAKVNEICFRYSGKDFYPGDLIPAEKLKTAVSSYPLPGSGPAMALIDCTILGSADDGVLIGLHGISWRNVSEPGSLRWQQMSSSSIAAKGFTTVALNANVKLDLAGSAFPREDAVKLLRELTEAYKYREPDMRSAPTNGGHKVDISSANQKALLTLPGIGPAEAALVLQARQETGGPYSLEELTALLQLKPHIVERLRGKATFSKRNPGVPPKAEAKPETPQSPKGAPPGPRGGGREID